MVTLTSGNPLKRFIKFAYPLLIANLIALSYNIIDAAIVGQALGYKALAAIGATDNINFFVNGFIGGFASGVAVVTAKYVGMGNKSTIKKSIAAAYTISLGLAFVFSFFAIIFCKPLLSLLKTPSDIIDSSSVYLLITYSGLIFQSFTSVTVNLCSANGDSRAPMILNLMSGFLKIALTYCFVNYLHLGVSGAAISTLIIRFLLALAMFIYSRSSNKLFILCKEDFKIPLQKLWESFSVGLALAMQSSVTGIGKIIFQSSLNSFSSAHIAAYASSAKIETVLHGVTSNLSNASMTFISQNYGAGKNDRVKWMVKASAIINMGFALIYSVVVLIFTKPLLSMFINKESIEAVMPPALQYCVTVACFYVVAALLISVRTSLQGMGHSSAAVIGAVAELINNCLIAFVLSGIWGFRAITLASPFSWIFASAPLTILLIRNLKKLPQNAVKILEV